MRKYPSPDGPAKSQFSNRVLCYVAAIVFIAPWIGHERAGAANVGYAVAPYWTNQVDIDGDGYFSAMNLDFVLVTDTGSATVYAAVFYKPAGSPATSWTYFNSSLDFTVTTAGYHESLPVPPNAHGLWDWGVDIYLSDDSPIGSLPDLLSHSEELPSEDQLTTAPKITSLLTGTGTIGVPYSYTITATGTTPITFGASPLPDGLSFLVDTISGTPTTAGVTNVALTASNGTLPNDIQTLVLTINPSPVATPTITPNGGGFVDSVQVTLGDATDGASIHYTLDGSTPDASPLSSYTGPFILNNGATVNAIAFVGTTASAMASATFVQRTAAAITLGSLSQTYDGTAKTVTFTTLPAGLAADCTYNGSPTPPTNAGTYSVVCSINDQTYAGIASDTLTINKAAGTVLLGSLVQPFDGTPKSATATTVPPGLAVTFTYDGSPTPPSAKADYTVVGTISDIDYQGSATGTLSIGKTLATVAIDNLTQTYDGLPKTVSVSTTPPGLAVNCTYAGSATNAGNYSVTCTISDASYGGSDTETLTIVKAAGSVMLGSTVQFYDGTPKTASATTTPPGLKVEFTYDGSATAPTTVATYALVGTLNDVNYQGSASGSFIIQKGTPVLAWNTPAPIAINSPLSAAQLKASANTPGVFTYNPPAGTTFPVSGPQTLTATFAPDDNIDFNPPSPISVSIDVVDALLALTSVPTALPQPAFVNTAVQFTTAANLTGTTFVWNFGDGSPDSSGGASVSHRYSTPGTYSATVTATHAQPTQTASGSVSVLVDLLGDGVPVADSDGDYFPDEIETALHSDPHSAGSLPLSLSSPTLAATPKGTKMSFKLNFIKHNSDSLSLKSAIAVAAGFSPQNKTVLLDAGGIVKSFSLDSKGSASAGFDKCKLSAAKKQKDGTEAAAISVALKSGNFLPPLADEQITNTTVKNASKHVLLTLIIDGKMYFVNVPQAYTATAGKKGSTK